MALSTGDHANFSQRSGWLVVVEFVVPETEMVGVEYQSAISPGFASLAMVVYSFLALFCVGVILFAHGIVPDPRAQIIFPNLVSYPFLYMDVAARYFHLPAPFILAQG